MQQSTTSRRDFLKKSSSAAMGLALWPYFGKKVAPSDRLRVAHIGLNGMGTSHLNWFAALPEVEVAALCDVDTLHLAKAAQTLQNKVPDAKPFLSSDFRKILERKDIDAITCATPDHWHAQIAIMAFEAGKDVYGEKPLSYSAHEGKMMLKAQKRYGKIFQLGTQIHAGDNYHRVQELIQAGTIGKVHTVNLWKTGASPIIPALNYGAVPSTLNYDFWQGPAPERPYAPERVHFNYRYFLDYSGGVFQDFWCHIADVVWMSIAPKALTKISAKGSKSDGMSDTPGNLQIDYEFDGLKLHWSSSPPNDDWAAKRHIGAKFIGDKGVLFCDYGSKEIHLNGVILPDIDSVPVSIQRSPGHQQNFVDAVKTRSQPESNLAYARQMTLPMHLGLISYRLGRSLAWNPKKEKFIGDNEANSLLFRPYRKAYDWV